VLNAAAEFARKYGDDVPLDYKEVAEIAGVTAAQVRRIIDAPRFESISSMVGAADGETPLADLLVDGTPGVEEQVLRTAEIRSIVEHGLPALDARELFVLARRFSLDGEPEQSLSAIGAMLGLSGEGVRQIQARAMAKLNHPAVLGRLVHDRPGAPAPAPRTAGDADSGNGLPSDDMLRRLRTRVRGG
jgi:DNA-directed RNA polymerase sigma subunit (sigma70/sigma32)